MNKTLFVISKMCGVYLLLISVLYYCVVNVSRFSHFTGVTIYHHLLLKIQK